jgi:hypothetical protein
MWAGPVGKPKLGAKLPFAGCLIRQLSAWPGEPHIAWIQLEHRGT